MAGDVKMRYSFPIYAKALMRNEYLNIPGHSFNILHSDVIISHDITTSARHNWLDYREQIPLTKAMKQAKSPSTFLQIRSSSSFPSSSRHSAGFPAFRRYLVKMLI